MSRSADGPPVLPIRERVAYVNAITRKRLDVLLPRMMRETGLDLWIVACNEDNLDPIFETMIPYGQWCPNPAPGVLRSRTRQAKVDPPQPSAV